MDPPDLADPIPLFEDTPTAQIPLPLFLQTRPDIALIRELRDLAW